MQTSDCAAAELVWVADTSVVYWCCFLVDTKFSNVQEILFSEVLIVLMLLPHPHEPELEEQLVSYVPAQYPSPYEIWHFIEI